MNNPLRGRRRSFSFSDDKKRPKKKLSSLFEKRGSKKEKKKEVVSPRSISPESVYSSAIEEDNTPENKLECTTHEDTSFSFVKNSQFFFCQENGQYEPKEVFDFVCQNMNMNEFIDNVVLKDQFFFNYHSNRGDKIKFLPKFERNTTGWYHRTVKFDMKVKVGFSKEAKFVPVIHRNRILLLQGNKGLLWQQSFQVSGFYGADTILLVANVYVVPTKNNSSNLNVSAKMAPIFIKNLTFLLRWKFKEVGFSMLNDCFQSIKEAIIETNNNLLVDKRMETMKTGEIRNNRIIESIEEENKKNKEKKLPKKKIFPIVKQKLSVGFQSVLKFLKFLFKKLVAVLNYLKHPEHLLYFIVFLFILLFISDWMFKKKLNDLNINYKNFMELSNDGKMEVLEDIKVCNQKVEELTTRFKEAEKFYTSLISNRIEKLGKIFKRHLYHQNQFDESVERFNEHLKQLQ